MIGLAIIKSEDLYVEMATDMMMQQESASELDTMFFKSVEEAKNWMFS